MSGSQAEAQDGGSRAVEVVLQVLERECVLKNVPDQHQSHSVERGRGYERVGDGTLGRGGQDRAGTEGTGNERGLHVERKGCGALDGMSRNKGKR
jgi:hypothetical protein